MNKLPIFKKGFSGGINFEKQNFSSRQYELFFFILLIIIFFIILFARLFQLTIVKGDYYRRLAENNRIREILIEPQRGKILDRKGFVVAKNLPADINLDLAKTQNHLDRLKSRRIYTEGEAIAHLVGYRLTADKNDLKNDNCITSLHLGDKTGKKGVEKLYDCDLRGQHGKKLIEVDAKGKYLRTLTIVPPENGKNIQLAFDFLLQKKTYELLKNLSGKKAAAVGVNPKTGEILFLVSYPSFDPQAFEDQNDDEIRAYFSDEKKPLFNRAAEGVYAPGSVFKLVVAAAALEEKTINEKTLIEDTGIINLGSLQFGNWYFLQYGKTDGMVDVIKAIQRSNDIFFYKIGEKLEADNIKKWAGIFGYGKKTGIGLDEAEGLIPSPFWKKEILKENWYTGDTYNMAIGQGYIGVTLLQTVMTTAAFANGGYLCQPQLLKTQNSKIPSTDRQDKTQNCKKLPLSQKTLNLIREGMRKACSPGGTGWPLFEFSVKNEKLKVEKKKLLTSNSLLTTEEIQTACKTGTAESQSKDHLPHAWITVFAPYDPPSGGPEIALTVLVENAGQGSDVAGPIARDILKAYFERKE